MIYSEMKINLYLNETTVFLLTLAAESWFIKFMTNYQQGKMIDECWRNWGELITMVKT